MAGSRFSKKAWQLRTLDVLGPGAPRKLGRAFDQALGSLKDARGLTWLNWRRQGSILWLHCADGPLPRRADHVRPEAIDRFNRAHPALLDRGYYLPPSGWEVLFLSDAHTEAHVTGLAGALADTLAAV